MEVTVPITSDDVAQAWAVWQDAERKWPPGDPDHRYANHALGRYWQLRDLYEHGGGDMAAVAKHIDGAEDRWPLRFPVFLPDRGQNPQVFPTPTPRRLRRLLRRSGQSRKPPPAR
jgi:hypothetical protein